MQTLVANVINRDHRATGLKSSAKSGVFKPANRGQ